MAYQQPKNEEKEALVNSASFQNQVKWALLTTANYWKNQDGTGKATAAEAEMWFRHRSVGMQLLLNPVGLINQQDYNLAGAFAGDYQIVDDGGAFDADATIAYMLTQNYFASIADKIFLIKVQSITF